MTSPVGGVITTLQGTTYGQTASITCHAGFELIGPSTVTCQADGTWSYTPTCERKGKHAEHVPTVLSTAMSYFLSLLS